MSCVPGSEVDKRSGEWRYRNFGPCVLSTPLMNPAIRECGLMEICYRKVGYVVTAAPTCSFFQSFVFDGYLSFSPVPVRFSVTFILYVRPCEVAIDIPQAA